MGLYTKKQVDDIRSYYRGMLKKEPKKEFVLLVHEYMYSLPNSKERSELWHKVWNRLHEIIKIT